MINNYIMQIKLVRKQFTIFCQVVLHEYNVSEIQKKSNTI